MPTRHVLPDSAELLQEIADAIWKAKKILVVTGAGISTNSGIPDFRSKNGLYSLIQAQFEAAAARKDDDNGEENEQSENEETDDTAPTSKRQRLSEEETEDVRVKEEPKAATNDLQDASQTTRRRSRRSGRVNKDMAPAAEDVDTIYCASPNPTGEGDCNVVQLPALDPKKFAQPLMTPKRRVTSRMVAVNDSIECLEPLPQSSSPLSSPPSVLFDPSEDFRSGSATARSSSSGTSAYSSDESDSEDTAPSSSQPTLSSQSSFASTKSTLPVMKGRDLFDASIWADPVKTSVFYTFATTLRQKVKDVVPTRSHEFISHLRDTNKLVRCYTQNIDEIEEKVGLSTSLILGPGKKGRFSTRSSASRASLGLGISAAGKDESSQESQVDGKDQQDSQELSSSQNSQSSEEPSASQSSHSSQSQFDPKTAKNRDPCFRGVECVFLHGSLRLLRCFRCGQTTPWDEAGREDETMCGRQPSCPRCAGATAAREGRGKRALAVGKLRPDIVLYGEEHPNAHLISPIVQHDLSLMPDMLLILGTSLKVHGLKVLVREFSKAVHSKGGKVVFVNFTKPPESVWSDIIDYWVQWDCDNWVDDVKQKKPIMWMPPGTIIEEPKKKRKSISVRKGGKRNSEAAKAVESTDSIIVENGSTNPSEGSEVDGQKPKKRRGRPPKDKADKSDFDKPDTTDKPEEANAALESSPPSDVATTDTTAQPKQEPVPEKEAAGEKKKTKRGSRPNSNAKNPAATKDDTANGAFTTWQIMQELARISGRPPPEGLPTKPARAAAPTKRKSRQRQSAPGELQIVLSALPPKDDVVVPAEVKQSLVPLPSWQQPEPTPVLQVPVMPLADISTNISLPAAPMAVIGSRFKYSTTTAVKAKPRVRKPRKIFEQGGDGIGGPMMVAVQVAQRRQLKPQPEPHQQPQQLPQPQLPQQPKRRQAKARARSKTMAAPSLLAPAVDAPRTPVPGWSDTDRLAEKLMMDLSESSSTCSSQPSMPTVPVTWSNTMHPPAVPTQTPLPQDTLSRTPPSAGLPPIRDMFADLLPPKMTDNTFFHQDPLGRRYDYPPPYVKEWSCTNQVEREAVEQQLKATVDAHRRRTR
ncbi:NAD-dependent deacetylase hst3 [Sporothrix eucalyptigena]